MCKNQAAPTNVLGRLFSILEIYLFIASETSMLKKAAPDGSGFLFSNAFECNPLRLAQLVACH